MGGAPHETHQFWPSRVEEHRVKSLDEGEPPCGRRLLKEPKKRFEVEDQRVPLLLLLKQALPAHGDKASCVGPLILFDLHLPHEAHCGHVRAAGQRRAQQANGQGDGEGKQRLHHVHHELQAHTRSGDEAVEHHDGIHARDREEPEALPVELRGRDTLVDGCVFALDAASHQP